MSWFWPKTDWHNQKSHLDAQKYEKILMSFSEKVLYEIYHKNSKWIPKVCPKVKTFDYFNNRQDVLKQRMTDLCISDYRKAMKSMPVRLLTEEESDLIANPLKYQMWHHSFDPHTQVSKIEEAYL